MLSPKRSKYRKQQKGRIHGVAKGGTTLNFGSFGLRAEQPGRITARQIEASRRAITRHLKRSGRMWIRIFPHKAITKKPAETRMGKGKGAPEYWVAVIKPGRILFEVEGLDEADAQSAFKVAAHKLPVKTKTVGRRELGA